MEGQWKFFGGGVGGGGGGRRQKTNYGTKLQFPEGWGVQTRNLPCRGVENFVRTKNNKEFSHLPVVVI